MKVAANSSLARRGTAVSVALLLAFLAAWQWGPGVLGIPVFIIPPLSSVFDEFLRMLAVSGLATHTGITAAEVIAGFLLGSLLGAFFGYVLGMSPTAEFALSPYILALQIAPKVAFAPLFILWMGFTVYPKILVAVLIVFFPVMVNVLTAIRNGSAIDTRSGLVIHAEPRSVTPPLRMEGPSAEPETVRVYGRVFGDGNKPVPGVTVKLENEQLKIARGAVTGADGAYSFTHVPPAEGYHMSIIKNGTIASRTSVTVQPARVNPEQVVLLYLKPTPQ